MCNANPYEFLCLQREQSFPVFYPSKARKGCKGRQGSHVGRSTCSPTAAELLNPPPTPNQDTSPFSVNHHIPQDITVKHNEAPGPDQNHSFGSEEEHGYELSQEFSHTAQTVSKRTNCKVQFDESLLQSSQKVNPAPISGTVRPKDQEMEANGEKIPSELYVKSEPSSKKENFKAGRNGSCLSLLSVVRKDLAGIESHAESTSSAASEQEKLAESGALSCSNSHPCILPRPPVLPGIHQGDKFGPAGKERLSLLDLQNSFSKSAAHRKFNDSITRAAVNLRDNVVTGKKHEFYGINSYYLRGWPNGQ